MPADLTANEAPREPISRAELVALELRVRLRRRGEEVTRVEGGVAQFERLKTAFVNLAVPVALQGEEHLSITPDQHTGAYYSYDVAKTIILAPYGNGRLMITICRQQRPSRSSPAWPVCC